MIAIINYGMGNLRSVLNAFEYIGAKVYIADQPVDLDRCQGIVLPGVGAFGDGMRNLREHKFIEALRNEVLQKKKQFLGICLGMQLLATTGREHGVHAGLNWIPGVVDRIPIDNSQGKFRVPHIGWNDVCFLKKSCLYDNLGESQAFYFVHSYVFLPEDASVINGVFSYGSDFAASIEFNNICATQFHPEKSHTAGLAVLRNWYSKIKNA